jgi:hypothetical protein
MPGSLILAKAFALEMMPLLFFIVRESFRYPRSTNRWYSLGLLRTQSTEEQRSLFAITPHLNIKKQWHHL